MKWKEKINILPYEDPTTVVKYKKTKQFIWRDALGEAIYKVLYIAISKYEKAENPKWDKIDVDMLYHGVSQEQLDSSYQDIARQIIEA